MVFRHSEQNGIVMPFCSLYMLYKFLPRRLCGLPTQKMDCLLQSLSVVTLCIIPRSAIGIHAIYVPLHIYHHAVIQHRI